MRILIAEDESVSRLVLSQWLLKLGHDVVVAHDGLAALRFFQREHFPVLITDWMMPEMDGLELCRRVRAMERTRYTYIVLLTAMGDRESYLKGMDAGVDDFVTKPFDPDQLAARLRVAERILSLQAEVRQLEGLLPICMYCKEIRGDNEKWTAVEHYVAARTDAEFSHTICPRCYEKHVKPELEELRRARGAAGSQE